MSMMAALASPCVSRGSGYAGYSCRWRFQR